VRFGPAAAQPLAPFLEATNDPDLRAIVRISWHVLGAPSAFIGMMPALITALREGLGRIPRLDT